MIERDQTRPDSPAFCCCNSAQHKQLHFQRLPAVQHRNLCTLGKSQSFYFFFKAIISKVALRTKQHLVQKSFTARESWVMEEMPAACSAFHPRWNSSAMSPLPSRDALGSRSSHLAWVDLSVLAPKKVRIPVKPPRMTKCVSFLSC